MLHAGFAQVDITPPINSASAIGSYRRRAMTGVHDPLLAAACVIDDGVTPIALVGIDAACIVRETADAAREQIGRETGIPPGNVIISASHTHQGGPLMSTFHAQADPAYAKRVAAGVAKAVADAWRARREVQVASGFGQVSGIHFNRRFLMRDGREVTHPGKLHPQIVRPAGPVDDKVGVLAFRDATGPSSLNSASGDIAGVVVNFACHCTVTEDGSEYSADYVHYLREHLRRTLPDAPPVVFLLGACGDVSQIDNQSAGVEKGHEHADRMGAALAREAARVIEQLPWQSSATCGLRRAQSSRVANQTTQIAVRERDASDPPLIGLGSGAGWEEIYSRERDLVAQMRASNPQIDCHITAARIGDLAIVANGAELFAQPALDIQSASAHPQTWVVTLANEYLGYVPTATAHFAGGYEPRTARSSFLAIDAAQQIVQASLAALQALS